MKDENFYVNVLQLIDVSSKRGAWGGPELEAVANVRSVVVEKLKALNANVKESVDVISSEETDKEEK